ncbi:MAG: helix-turn-helix domain-containing protein [Methylococcaceae bacterium]
MPRSTATDTSTQQFVILAHLKINGSMTTLQARQELDVMHPAARVQELREKGHNIMTHWTVTQGHRIAVYVLLAGRYRKKEIIAAVSQPATINGRIDCLMQRLKESVSMANLSIDDRLITLRVDILTAGELLGRCNLAEVR